MNWISPHRPTPSERPHLRALYAHLVQGLFEHSRIPTLTLFGSMFLLYIVLLDFQATRPVVRILIVSMAAVVGFRALLAYREDWVRARIPSLGARFGLHVALSALTALGLGSLVAICALGLDPGRLLLICFWLAGSTAIAAISMAGSPIAYALYLVPSLFPLAWVGPRAFSEGIGVLFSASVGIYAVSLWAISWNIHGAVRRNYMLSRQLEDLALRDPLTGLRNRRYLVEFMEEESPRVMRRWLNPELTQSPRRSVTLLVVDLDRFKAVNDQYGHQAGDFVLQQAARLLKEVVRKPDLVVRWGGEEFVVVALDSDRVLPPLIAQRIRERFALHEFRLPGGEALRCTCSIGYALFPFLPERPDGLDWDQVLRLADEGLFRSKRAGRNCLRGFQPGGAPPAAILGSLRREDLDAATLERDGMIREA